MPSAARTIPDEGKSDFENISLNLNFFEAKYTIIIARMFAASIHTEFISIIAEPSDMRAVSSAVIVSAVSSGLSAIIEGITIAEYIIWKITMPIMAKSCCQRIREPAQLYPLLTLRRIITGLSSFELSG